MYERSSLTPNMVKQRKSGASMQNMSATVPYAVWAFPPMVLSPVVNIGMKRPARPPPMPATRFVIAVSLSLTLPSLLREGIMPQ